MNSPTVPTPSLWLPSAPSKMSQRALEVCKDPENLLVFSVPSAWEIEIEQQLGKT